MQCQISLCVDHSYLGTSTGRNFIDLKQNPEQISLIPQIKDWPEFEALIRDMNSEASILKTVGCGAGLVNTKDQSGVLQKSHVGFCFNRLEANQNVMRYYEFFHFFSGHLASHPLPPTLAMMFEIKQREYENSTGFMAAFHVTGHGESQDQARQIANIGYTHFKNFLDRDGFRDRFY